MRLFFMRLYVLFVLLFDVVRIG